ncbi:MAG: C1 family peptidase [Armatimonadota bacterium]|nr:MAG: C1 family peptidase [Armatimonadota bacterium]
MSNLSRTRRPTLTLLVLLLLVALAASIACAGIAARVQARPSKLLIEGVPEKVIQLPPTRLAQVKQGKRVADMQQLSQTYFVRNNVPFIRGRAGDEFELISLDKMEYTPSQPEIRQSQQLIGPVIKYRSWIFAEPITIEPIPDVVDHRPNQTSIKDQNNRGTCVCFASLAGLEVAYGGGSLDLSEQFANYLYMTAESRGCKSAGLKTTDSANYLKNDGVCLESVCPYQNDKYNFPAYCNNADTTAPAPPMLTNAVANRPYKIKSYQKIWRKDNLTTDTGTWINNPRYLESLLRAGKDIVFGTHVAGWISPYTGIIDVSLGSGGYPLPSVGGHAMLVVGYNRPQEYFIVKNSWGTSYGQSGYLYLSYDYIRTYAKYGYIINEVEPIPIVPLRPMLRAIPRALPSR